MFSQISRGFDDILPFFTDEYTVYDFQTFGEIVESPKYQLEHQLEYNQLESILQKLQNSINIFAKTRGVVCTVAGSN